MSESRAHDVDAAIALIRQAMDKVDALNRTPQEGVTTNGIVVTLESVITRIEALSGDDAG